jgi:hypothetical protein
MFRFSKFVGCLAALAMIATAFAAAPQVQDNPEAIQVGSPQIPLPPYHGVLRTHMSGIDASTDTTTGPVATGVDVLGPLFDGPVIGVAPQTPGGVIWTRIQFLNDGTIQLLVPDLIDPAIAIFAEATNVNWVDDFGYDTYFSLTINHNALASATLVSVGGTVLTLQDPDEIPYPQPFGLFSVDGISDELDLIGFESDNGLLGATVYVDDVVITVGGVEVMNNGFESAQGLEKGPLDGQPSGNMGEETLWSVTAASPITFVSGNAPFAGEASMQMNRNAGGAFSFTGIQGDIDETFAAGDTLITLQMRIGNGQDGTAADLGGPSVACRQIGTVADPDDEGETCCEFEWSYSNTTSDFILFGGFIALEAGNGGPCSNTEEGQIDSDIDFFFGDIDFCRGDVGGAGWSNESGNNRVVLDLDGLDLDGDEQATGRIRLKTHTGAAFGLPDGTMIEDGQVLAAASIFSPNAFGGPDFTMPEGLDCQSQFGPHMNTVYDVLWFDTAVWQWRPLLPVPALSFGGKMLLLAGVGLVGIILIARSRKTATA